MAQDLTVFNQQHWAPEMQMTYFKENVARAIANEELRDVLVDGTRVHKPYRSSLKAQDYTKGTPISTFNDLGGADEYLDVDTVKIVPMYVDDLDKLQNKWDMAMIFARDAQQNLNNLIDQAVLAEYSNAASYISAQDLGGSGTGSYPISISNVDRLFTVAGRNLDKGNRGQNERFAIIGPRLREIIKLYVGARETGFGDTVGANGYVGTRFGFDLYFSNNIPFTAVVTSDAIGVAGEYFYVDGVKFTFVANGTATTAGDISIGDSEAATMANVVLAINGTGTPGASTYIDVSADDRETLYNGSISASFDTHTLTITGYGDVAITEAASNLVVTSNTQYPLFGVKGSTDLVVQKEPNLEFRVCENLLGRKVYAWTTYGKKTFTKSKKGLVYAKIDTSAWV